MVHINAEITFAELPTIIGPFLPTSSLVSPVDSSNSSPKVNLSPLLPNYSFSSLPTLNKCHHGPPILSIQNPRSGPHLLPLFIFSGLFLSLLSSIASFNTMLL